MTYTVRVTRRVIADGLLVTFVFVMITMIVVVAVIIMMMMVVVMMMMVAMMATMLLTILSGVAKFVQGGVVIYEGEFSRGLVHGRVSSSSSSSSISSSSSNSSSIHQAMHSSVLIASLLNPKPHNNPSTKI